MARLPPSTLLLKSSPAAPLFRFASLPRPLVPRLHGSLRPGASRSSLAPPPLAFRSATKPRSSMARSLLSRLLPTLRTVARWFLFASSPSHSAAMWPGILLFTPSPSRICFRSREALSFPPASVISAQAGIHSLTSQSQKGMQNIRETVGTDCVSYMVEEVFVVCSCSSLFFLQFRSATKPLVCGEELALLRCALKTEGQESR